MKTTDLNILTQIIKAGEGLDFSHIRTPGVPIFQTSNYLYDDVESGTDVLEETPAEFHEPVEGSKKKASNPILHRILLIIVGFLFGAVVATDALTGPLG